MKWYLNFKKIKTKNTNVYNATKTIWQKLFNKYLLATNIISSGVLMSLGDLLSQKIEHKFLESKNKTVMEKKIDWERCGRMFLVGASQGPLHHYYYGWIDKILPGLDKKSITKKILYDQLLMGPLCLVIFFYTAGFLEGKTSKQCQDELKSKFIPIYITDWSVWPAAQFINFYYLQPKYRVIYVNIVTMLYDIFLSYMKHKND